MLDLENNLEKILNTEQSPAQFEYWYMEIINNAKPRGLDKSKLSYYTEKHHITPNCLGGKNSEDNYVLLNALEHIVVHILLCYRYPHSSELSYAAWRMINPAKKDINANGKVRVESEIKLRLFAVDKISLVTTSKIKELYIKNISTPIVGYNDNFEVLRIYTSSKYAESDGIERTTIQKAAKYSIKSFGINWDYLSNFKINHQDEVDKFNLDRELGKELPSLNINKEEYLKNHRLAAVKKAYESRTNIKPIVGYNFDTDEIKIYKTGADTVKDGFSNSIILRLLKKNKYKSMHKGLYWMYLDEFSKLYPQALDELNKKIKEGNTPEIKYRESKKLPLKSVIRYSEDNKIEKIYKVQKQAEKEGFDHKGISRSIETGKTYKGFYWSLIDNWVYLDKLEEYFKQHPEDKP